MFLKFIYGVAGPSGLRLGSEYSEYISDVSNPTGLRAKGPPKTYLGLCA
jgi:hypothetical protein